MVQYWPSGIGELGERLVEITFHTYARLKMDRAEGFQKPTHQYV